MWALQLYIRFFFCQTSTHHSRSPRRPFFEPSSATGSASRHLHQDYLWATFPPGPPGRPYAARYACALSHLSNTCSYLLSYSDIVHFGYLVGLCAGPRSATLHVTPSGIYSALACSLSHGIAFTFQSHPLMLAFRIPIPGSTVLTPPFAFLGVLSPGSILTYMSRPIHSTCLHL
jgi:hypothetical protein